MCRLKAKAGKLWSHAQVLVNKKVSVLNSILNTSVLFINRFIVVCYGFDFKVLNHISSKQWF